MGIRFDLATVAKSVTSARRRFNVGGSHAPVSALLRSIGPAERRKIVWGAGLFLVYENGARRTQIACVILRR